MSYGHTAWTLRNAHFRGAPRMLAQTADGYLWLATEFGLLRFDGVRFVPWSPPDRRFPSDDVVSLRTTSDGSLWLGTTEGLARWKNGRLTVYDQLANQYVTVIQEAPDGIVWVGTSARVRGNAKLCAIAVDSVKCAGNNGTFGRFVLSLHVDHHQNLWVGSATGLWRWRPGTPIAFPLPSKFSEVHAFAEHEDGTLLLALSRGIRALDNGRLQANALPQITEPIKPTAMLRDRDGGLWIGTQDRGLLHVAQGRVTRFARKDGLSGDFVSDIFEDREGNIWVATLDGLDRFHNLAIPTISAASGLSASSVVSLVADPDGAVWLGTVNGLNRWRDDRVTMYPVQPGATQDGVASMLRDSRGRLWVSSLRGLAYLQDGRFVQVADVPGGYVHAMVEDREGDIWVADQERGLFQLRDARLVRQVRWSALGGKVARALVADPARGGVWLGFFQGGVAHFSGERVDIAFGEREGLGAGPVTHLYLEVGGALWSATRGGLSRWRNGEVRTLTQQNGLPCDVVHWATEDAARTFWLYTACGIVRITRADLATWDVDPSYRIAPKVYSDRDGVPSRSQAGSYGPKVVKTSDGRLLFATYDGVSIIEPSRIVHNDRVPPVHIEQVIADGVTYEPSSAVRLPSNVRNLRIDYTALSLSVPEKVRFRYKLEGRDHDWVEVQNRREVFYTDLPPRQYRFRVLAANNDGVWNTEGAALDVTIPPAFYQTRLFLTVTTALFLIALWAAYRGRLYRIATQMQLRFEERLNERARIAQDLHDTLLGGFISAAMHLDTIVDGVDDPPMKSALERVLRRMREVIDEGRNALQGLRSMPALDDLEQALARSAQDLRGDQPVRIHLVVTGQRCLLHPLTRDEIYRIGHEALANAFRHAHAARVDIQLDYAEAQFRLRVRDDGQGFDSHVADVERPGHWGISGMRERAERLGAKLELWSRSKAGTEIDLVVPGVIAYQRVEASGRPWRRWLDRLVDLQRS